MQDQEVVRLLGRGQLDRGLHGAGHSEVLRQRDDPGLTEGLIQERSGVVGRSVIDGDDAQARMRLRRQRREALVEPGGAVMNHEHDEDARRSDGVGGGGRIG